MIEEKNQTYQEVELEKASIVLDNLKNAIFKEKKKNQTLLVMELIKAVVDFENLKISILLEKEIKPNLSNYKIAKDLGFTESSVSSWGKTVNSAQYNSIAKVIKHYKLHKNKEFQEAFWKLM